MKYIRGLNSVCRAWMSLKYHKYPRNNGILTFFLYFEQVIYLLWMWRWKLNNFAKPGLSFVP